MTKAQDALDAAAIARTVELGGTAPPVTPPPSPPAITSAALPAATAGKPYTAGPLGATGTGPLTFTATALPAGLTMSPAGVITGTPTTAGVFRPAFTVHDGNGLTATKVLALTVAAASSESPDGTTVTTAGPTITDKAGNTFGLNTAAEVVTNGAADAGTNSVDKLYYKSPTVYQHTTRGQWYSPTPTNLAAWAETADPTAPVPPVVPPPNTGGAMLLGGDVDENNLAAYPKTFATITAEPIPAGALTATPANLAALTASSPAGSMFALAAGQYTVPFTIKAGNDYYGQGPDKSDFAGIGFQGGGNDVGVHGVSVHGVHTPGNPTGKGAGYQCHAGIESDFNSDVFQGWVVSRVKVYDCDNGIEVGSGSHVEDWLAYDNWQCGFGGGGSGTTWEFGASYANGGHGVDDSGNKSGLVGNTGNKNVQQTINGGPRTIMRNLYLGDNNQVGYWSDVSGYGIAFSDLVVARNYMAGLMSEIDKGSNTFAGTILICGNGKTWTGDNWQGAGLLLSSSHGDTVDGSSGGIYVWHNGDADIQVYDQDRGQPGSGGHVIKFVHTEKPISTANVKGGISLAGNIQSDPNTWIIPKVACGPRY